MRRSVAARYARWSAITALVLAGITLAVYLKRDFNRLADRRHAPAPTPAEVSRQSSKITFSKSGTATQPIFTVEASKSTEFRDQNSSLLENVEVTIYGKAGDRHDTIHTKSCTYGAQKQTISCDGDVEINLLSAEQAQRTANDPAAAKALMTQIETRGVNFDRDSGTAHTDQPVQFTFPGGSGSGVGMEYNSDQGTARLLKNVSLVFLSEAAAGKNAKPPASGAGPSGQQVHVAGTMLDFTRDSRLVHLSGPVEAHTETDQMTAGDATLLLSENLRADTLTATAGPGTTRPALTSNYSGDQMRVEGDTLTAHFSPDGSIKTIFAQGTVQGVRTTKGEKDESTSDSGTLQFWPGQPAAARQIGVPARPKELNMNGHVMVKAQLDAGKGTRILRTNALRMTFRAPEKDKPTRPEFSETLAPGTIEWTEVSAQGGPSSKTDLRADKLIMDFDAEGKANKVRAAGNVETQRTLPGHPLQTAIAKNGEAQLLPSGSWSQVDLQGNVKLKEGDRTGSSDRAVFLRDSQTATLTGQAMAQDATTITRAPRITFVQTTGDIEAEGGVRSTDLSPNGSGVQLAPVPANIVAKTLVGNSQTGRALYSGNARLWQGDSVLEADSIELLRDAHILNASGNVRGVFPQAAGQSAGTAQVKPVKSSPSHDNAKMQLWHVSAATLSYHDSENYAHLEHNVVVQSEDQRMNAPSMDVFFTRSDSPVASPASRGAQQVSRAAGRGGVTVIEGLRKAVAEQGDYSAETGKFVMTGGSPTLYDGVEGTTTGRQLTFFLADDTIIVDSGNGSRTLTKHRVEK